LRETIGRLKAEGVQAEGATQAFRLKAVRLKVGVQRSGHFSLNPFGLCP
jgi:hypothetical protein